MTEKELREKVAFTASEWSGCNGKDGTKNPIIDLYNSHTPLARGYKVTYKDYWCATFVSAVAIKCELTDIMPTECSCKNMILLYQKMGRWQENDSYVPQTGDIIMYDWDDSGVGDCTGGAEHVGIVTSVAGTKITVIEGNKNDAVGYRTMQVNGRYIRGYCLPDYAKKAAELTANENTEDDDMITQEQFNSMMDTYLESLATKAPDTWSVNARNWAEKNGIVSGDNAGNMRYKVIPTKEEIVQMLYNMNQKA